MRPPRRHGRPIKKSILAVITAFILVSGITSLLVESQKAELKNAQILKRKQSNRTLLKSSKDVKHHIDYVFSKALNVWKNYHRNKNRLPNPRKFEMATGPLAYWAEWRGKASQPLVSGLSREIANKKEKDFINALNRTTLDHSKKLNFELQKAKLFPFRGYTAFLFVTPRKSIVSGLFQNKNFREVLPFKSKVFISDLDGNLLSKHPEVSTRTLEKMKAALKKKESWINEDVQSDKFSSLHLKKNLSLGYAVGFLEPKTSVDTGIQKASSKFDLSAILFIAGLMSLASLFFFRKRKDKTRSNAKPKAKRKPKRQRTPETLPKLFAPQKNPVPVRNSRVQNALEIFQETKREKSSFKIASQFEQKALELRNPKLVKSIFVQSVSMLCESPILYFKFDPRQDVAILEIDGGFEQGEAPATLSFDIPKAAQGQIQACSAKGKLASLANYPLLTRILLDRMGVACFEAWAISQKTNSQLIGVLVILHSGVKSTQNRDLIIRMMRTVSDSYDQYNETEIQAPIQKKNPIPREI